MEINNRFIFVLAFTLLSSCTKSHSEKFAHVHGVDFGTDDPKTCPAGEVDLSSTQAKDFFVRAKQIDSRTLHDFYDVAPCYMEGTLKFQGKACTFKIRAGATATITCQKEKEIYFACDDCKDLFGGKK